MEEKIIINTKEIDKTAFLEKETKVNAILKDHKDLDILKLLAIFGLQEYKKKNDIKDTLIKISECNVLIYNMLKNDDSNNELLLDTIYSWILKEQTPIEFKAKFR